MHTHVPDPYMHTHVPDPHMHIHVPDSKEAMCTTYTGTHVNMYYIFMQQRHCYQCQCDVIVHSKRNTKTLVLLFEVDIGSYRIEKGRRKFKKGHVILNEVTPQCNSVFNPTSGATNVPHCKKRCYNHTV